MDRTCAVSDDDEGWARQRRSVVRDALAVGVSTGAYGLSFGAVAATAGLSLPQASALSLLMFTGASQFALVGVLAGGGAPLAAAATATLLGARNAFYGLRLASVLSLRGPRRLLAAHLVLDESSAMATLREDPRESRLAFWATGVAVFVFWNIATVAGAAGAGRLADPTVLGLDAAAPAAFLALLAPRLRDRSTWALTAAAAAVALALTPVVPAGVPILASALLVVAVASRRPLAATGAA